MSLGDPSSSLIALQPYVSAVKAKHDKSQPKLQDFYDSVENA